MIINIVIGFILPLIFGICLYKNNSRVVIFIAPISSVVSFTFNQIGYSAKFWVVTPIIKENETLSALPMDIGIYPFLACLMIYIIIAKSIKPFYAISLFTIVTTLLEFICFLLGKVIYQRGWNLFITFLSYACAYFLCYLYFILIKKFVFEENIDK
ncbi:MAG: CBO0543 family protein [Ruminiclostridium sp.]